MYVVADPITVRLQGYTHIFREGQRFVIANIVDPGWKVNRCGYRLRRISDVN